MAVHHRARERDGARIALRRQLGDDRPSGIPQAECLGNLVEGLPHRVVDGGAEDYVVAPRAHVHQHGIAAADEARHERRLEVGRLEEVREEVPLEVVHRDERQPRGGAEALGEGNAHDERAHEAGACGDGDGGEVGRRERVAAERLARLCQGLFERAHDGLGMLARGDLGHHAAEACMEVDLGGDDAREHAAGRVDHGDGRLVAGGFDGEDEVTGCGDRLLGCRIARSGLDGPRADRSGGLGQLAVVGREERQLGRHDEGIVALAVVVGTTAGLLEAELAVQGARGLVVDFDLERDGQRVEHLGVVGEARKQARGDSLAAAVVRDRDVGDLEVVAAELTAREPDDGAAVVRDPPAPMREHELVLEHLALPRHVRHLRERKLLEGGHLLAIVD